MKVKIYTDGGARGNPGPAGIGVVIKNEKNKVLLSYGKYIGEQTNNVAEYSALISALQKAIEMGGTQIDCFLDSKLVVEQLKRKWKVKEPSLQKLFIQAYNLSSKFKKITYTHIYRERNTEADRMVNEALDNRK